MNKEFVSYRLALELENLGMEDFYKLAFIDNKNIIYLRSESYAPHSSIDTMLWQQAFQFCLKQLNQYAIRYWGDCSGSVIHSNKSELDFDSREECLEILIKLLKEKIGSQVQQNK